MSIFSKIAEEKIQEAMRKGEFDDLPGQGKPLDLEDDSHIPEDLRMAYKILKNAGFVPPELAQAKEITNIRELLENMDDESEKYRQMQKLNLLIAKMNMTPARAAALAGSQNYYEKIVEKTPVRKKTESGLGFAQDG